MPHARLVETDIAKLDSTRVSISFREEIEIPGTWNPLAVHGSRQRSAMLRYIGLFHSWVILQEFRPCVRCLRGMPLIFCGYFSYAVWPRALPAKIRWIPLEDNLKAYKRACEEGDSEPR